MTNPSAVPFPAGVGLSYVRYDRRDLDHFLAGWPYAHCISRKTQMVQVTFADDESTSAAIELFDKDENLTPVTDSAMRAVAPFAFALIQDAFETLTRSKN